MTKTLVAFGASLSAGVILLYIIWHRKCSKNIKTSSKNGSINTSREEETRDGQSIRKHDPNNILHATVNGVCDLVQFESNCSHFVDSKNLSKQAEETLHDICSEHANWQNAKQQEIGDKSLQEMECSIEDCSNNILLSSGDIEQNMLNIYDKVSDSQRLLNKKNNIGCSGHVSDRSVIHNLHSDLDVRKNGNMALGIDEDCHGLPGHELAKQKQRLDQTEQECVLNKIEMKKDGSFLQFVEDMQHVSSARDVKQEIEKCQIDEKSRYKWHENHPETDEKIETFNEQMTTHNRVEASEYFHATGIDSEEAATEVIKGIQEQIATSDITEINEEHLKTNEVIIVIEEHQAISKGTEVIKDHPATNERTENIQEQQETSVLNNENPLEVCKSVQEQQKTTAFAEDQNQNDMIFEELQKINGTLNKEYNKICAADEKQQHSFMDVEEQQTCVAVRENQEISMVAKEWHAVSVPFEKHQDNSIYIEKQQKCSVAVEHPLCFEVTSDNQAVFEKTDTIEAQVNGTEAIEAQHAAFERNETNGELHIVMEKNENVCHHSETNEIPSTLLQLPSSLNEEHYYDNHRMTLTYMCPYFHDYRKMWEQPEDDVWLVPASAGQPVVPDYLRNVDYHVNRIIPKHEPSTAAFLYKHLKQLHYPPEHWVRVVSVSENLELRVRHDERDMMHDEMERRGVQDSVLPPCLPHQLKVGSLVAARLHVQGHGMVWCRAHVTEVITDMPLASTKNKVPHNGKRGKKRRTYRPLLDVEPRYIVEAIDHFPVKSDTPVPASELRQLAMHAASAPFYDQIFYLANTMPEDGQSYSAAAREWLLAELQRSNYFLRVTHEPDCASVGGVRYWFGGLALYSVEGKWVPLEAYLQKAGYGVAIYSGGVDPKNRLDKCMFQDGEAYWTGDERCPSPSSKSCRLFSPQQEYVFIYVMEFASIGCRGLRLPYKHERYNSKVEGFNMSLKEYCTVYNRHAKYTSHSSELLSHLQQKLDDPKADLGVSFHLQSLADFYHYDRSKFYDREALRIHDSQANIRLAFPKDENGFLIPGNALNPSCTVELLRQPSSL